MSRCTCGEYSCAFLFACEAAGVANTRHSLRPLHVRAWFAKLGATIAREKVERCAKRCEPKARQLIVKCCRHRCNSVATSIGTRQRATGRIFTMSPKRHGSQYLQLLSGWGGPRCDAILIIPSRTLFAPCATNEPQPHLHPCNFGL